MINIQPELTLAVEAYLTVLIYRNGRQLPLAGRVVRARLARRPD